MKFLTILAWLCGAAAFFMTMWIVVPAPASRLWLVAVGASEWSLWLGALGFAGVGFSLLALASGARWSAWTALVLGTIAVACAMIPPLSAWRVARAYNLQLSLKQYLVGADPASHSKLIPQTMTYATANGRPLQLDVYLPREQATVSRPAIIVIHGGSWNAGDKGDFPQWNFWLTQHGFAIFDIQYRLTPQPNWQTATGDVKCAISWVKNHASQFNIDPQRIALFGRSAGAHLALLAAYASADPALPPSCEAQDTHVQAVISLYGTTDLIWGYEHPANQRVIDGPETLRRFLGGDPVSAREAFRLASPVTHVDAQTPPTLLFHGGRDQLIRPDNMNLLAQQLEAARAAHRAVLIPYAQHGFDYNFNGWGSQIAQPLILDFLQKHLAQE